MAFPRYTRKQASFGSRYGHNMGRYSTPRQKNCSITWDGGLGAYAVHADYDKTITPKFVELIKGMVPVNMRTYDPDTYIWYVTPGEDDKYYKVVKLLMEATFQGWNFSEYTKAEYEAANQWSAGATVVDVTNKALETIQGYAKQSGYSISRETTFSDAQKIYRKLAITWHPDKNPANGPVMSAINEAWSNLKDKGVFKNA